MEGTEKDDTQERDLFTPDLSCDGVKAASSSLAMYYTLPSVCSQQFSVLTGLRLKG